MGQEYELTSVERSAISPSGDLGPFQTVPGVTLARRRQSFATAVVDGFLYAFGGTDYSTALASVERAAIDSGGNLSPFETLSGTPLAVPRNDLRAAVIGRDIHVIGGRQGVSSSGYALVEKTTVNADGSLGSFVTPSASLSVGRFGFQSAVIDKSLFVIGGYNASELSSVERASVNSSGNLGTFGAAPGGPLASGRTGSCAAIVGNRLYVIGGERDGVGYMDTIDQAAIGPDGTLGPFSLVAGRTLAAPRAGFSCAVIKNYLYVVGGTNGSGPRATVERALINGDGTLDTFGAGGTLTTGRQTPGVAVIGDYLYVIGGYTTSGTYTTSVERSFIDASGNLTGGFSNVAGVTLNTGRFSHATAVVGSYIYVLGGGVPGTIGTIERASVNASGITTTLTLVSGRDLGTARQGHLASVVGNYLYVFGGFAGTNAFASVERAVIDSNSGIGNFAAVPDAVLSPAVVNASHAVAGNCLYLFGGNRPTIFNGITDVQRATLQ